MYLVIEYVSKSVLWGIVAAITFAVLIILCHSKEKRLGKMIILILMSFLLVVLTKVMLFSLLENIELIYSLRFIEKEETKSAILIVTEFIVFPIITTFDYSIIKATRRAVITWIRTKDAVKASEMFGIDFGNYVKGFMSFLKSILIRIRDLDFSLGEEKTGGEK